MNVSLKINRDLVESIQKKYKDYQKPSPMDYVVFFAQFSDITITIFKSPKKILYSLTITAKNETHLKKMMNDFNLHEQKIAHINLVNKNKQTVSQDFLFLEEQIGSDEVGTGDFFGPITVVAGLVKKNQIKRLKELGIMDSKKLTDERIITLGKIVIKEFKHSLLILDNKKYNQLAANGFNMNKIKCYLHNCALRNLHHRFPKIHNIYVDQFVDEKKYYEYLKDEKNVLHGIYFHTKGESYFPSVALASVIARYSFLKQMDLIAKKYNLAKIPFGAGASVDQFAKLFKEKYGQKELDKIVKKNFKNYQKLI